MRHVSLGLYDLLMRQGIEAGRAGTLRASEMIAHTNTGAAWRGAGTAGGENPLHPRMAGVDATQINQPMGIGADVQRQGEEASSTRPLIARQGLEATWSETVNSGKRTGAIAPAKSGDQGVSARIDRFGRSPFVGNVLEVHSNPNMTNMAMGLSARPYSVAPAGADKPILTLIQGGRA